MAARRRRVVWSQQASHALDEAVGYVAQESLPGARRLLDDVEMPLVPVLADMEMSGVALDVDYLHRMSQELSQRLDQIERQVHAAVGWQFNLNSPPQL